MFPECLQKGLMQKNPATITIVLTLAIVGFVLWRNYGVIAVGETIDPDTNKTNEQKELKKASSESWENR